jgi:hypothetical protein
MSGLSASESDLPGVGNYASSLVCEDATSDADFFGPPRAEASYASAEETGEIKKMVVVAGQEYFGPGWTLSQPWIHARWMTPLVASVPALHRFTRSFVPPNSCTTAPASSSTMLRKRMAVLSRAAAQHSDPDSGPEDRPRPGSAGSGTADGSGSSTAGSPAAARYAHMELGSDVEEDEEEEIVVDGGARAAGSAASSYTSTSGSDTDGTHTPRPRRRAARTHTGSPARGAPTYARPPPVSHAYASSSRASIASATPRPQKPAWYSFDLPVALALVAPLGNVLTGGDHVRNVLLLGLLVYFLHQVIEGARAAPRPAPC